MISSNPKFPYISKISGKVEAMCQPGRLAAPRAIHVHARVTDLIDQRDNAALNAQCHSTGRPGVTP